jgi:hypothetical protein
MEHDGKQGLKAQSDSDEREKAEEKAAPVRKQKTETAISGQIATYTLLFLFSFVAFLVWISG